MVSQKPHARFCGTMCKQGLAEDRRYGLFYPAIYEMGDDDKLTGNVYSVEDWSLVACCCAYCGALVPHSRPVNVPPTFPKR